MNGYVYKNIEPKNNTVYSGYKSNVWRTTFDTIGSTCFTGKKCFFLFIYSVYISLLHMQHIKMT